MRGDRTIRAIKVFSVLLDGRSHTMRAFSDFHLNKKTLYRILKELENCEELKVSYRNQDGINLWRSDYKLKNIPANYKIKRCGLCTKDKDIEEFNKNRHTIDGHSNYCRECASKVNKDNYLKNREAKLVYEKKRYKRDRQKRLILQRKINQRKKVNLIQG